MLVLNSYKNDVILITTYYLNKLKIFIFIFLILIIQKKIENSVNGWTDVELNYIWYDKF